MEEKNELLPFPEAPRAPAPDPGEGLSTPAAGHNTYIGLTSSMRSIMTLSEHVGLQADQEQVLCRELVCVCKELQSCCEHAASALTVHPRVQTLIRTRLSALLQTGTMSQVTYRGQGDTGHNQRHVMKVRTRTLEKGENRHIRGSKCRQ